MSKTPVPFSPETLETIQRAFRHASRRRHDTVGLEHLLLSITEEPTARQQLTACGADLVSLRSSVTDVLEKAFVPVPGSASVEPEPTVAFDRVVQQAVVHASASSATQVDTGSLLAGVPAIHAEALSRFTAADVLQPSVLQSSDD